MKFLYRLASDWSLDPKDSTNKGFKVIEIQTMEELGAILRANPMGFIIGLNDIYDQEFPDCEFELKLYDDYVE